MVCLEEMPKRRMIHCRSFPFFTFMHFQISIVVYWFAFLKIVDKTTSSQPGISYNSITVHFIDVGLSLNVSKISIPHELILIPISLSVKSIVQKIKKFLMLTFLIFRIENINLSDWYNADKQQSSVQWHRLCNIWSINK